MQYQRKIQTYREIEFHQTEAKPAKHAETNGKSKSNVPSQANKAH